MTTNNIWNVSPYTNFYFFVHNLSCHISNASRELINVFNHIWWYVTCFLGSRTWDLYLLLCPDSLGMGIAHWASVLGDITKQAEQDSKQHQFYWQMFIAVNRWSASRHLVSATASSQNPNQNSSGDLPQDQPLHQQQQVLDGVDAKVGQPKVQLWVWEVAKLVSLVSRGHQPWVRC